MSKSNNKTHYVNSDEFHTEFKSCLEVGKPSARLMVMFEKIARGKSRTYFQNNRIDTEAAISYAVTEAWLKWKKYDKNRSENIFAFFTTIIDNDMKTYYNRNKKYSKRNISLDAIFAGNKN